MRSENRSSKLLLEEDFKIFSEGELKAFLNQEEVEALLVDLKIDSNTLFNEYISSEKKTKIANLFFDKFYLVMKILKAASEKLRLGNEKILAKGIDWVTHEVQDSLFYLKTDDTALQRIEKMKDKSQELESIFSWMEEYSSTKFKHKETIEHVLQKNYSSSGFKELELNPIESFSVHEHLKKKQSFINFSEECFVKIEDPIFDIFKLEEEVGKENTLSTISSYVFMTLGLFSIINYNTFENFIQAVTQGYNRSAPYHNDLHAADVEQTCFLYMKHGRVSEKARLSPLDESAFLVSAVIHDFKHPGMTNNFLINSKSDVAIFYNDQSVLENFHVAETFKLIKSNEKYNIMSELSNDEYKLFRKRIVECVLSTDMTFHTKLYSYIKAKKDKFLVFEGKNVENVFEGLDSVALFSTQQDFLNILLHTADISNPTKPINVYEKWVEHLMKEFWNQGDKEKELKLPISFLCDRTTTNVPKAQIGFIDGIVFPMLSIIVDFFPGLDFLMENCMKNKEHYKKIVDEEENSKIK